MSPSERVLLGTEPHPSQGRPGPARAESPGTATDPSAPQPTRSKTPPPPSKDPELAARIDQAIAALAGITWPELHPNQWADSRDVLYALALELGPPDPIPTHWPARAPDPWPYADTELRQRAFTLYIQLGRVANTGRPSPPDFVTIGTISVNYYWWLAASMATADPGLLTRLRAQPQPTRDDVEEELRWYLELFVRDPQAPRWTPRAD